MSKVKRYYIGRNRDHEKVMTEITDNDKRFIKIPDDEWVRATDYDEAEQSRDINHAAAKMALDQRDDARELRECVQASDYDDLRGQLGDSRESYIRVKEAAAHSQRRAEEAESKLAAATRERDEATARLNAIIPSCEDWEARERDAERWRFIQSRA